MDLPLKTDNSCNCSDGKSNTGDQNKYLDDCKTSGVSITHFGNGQTSDQNKQNTKTMFAVTPSTKIW